jgi:hypothetical protein
MKTLVKIIVGLVALVAVLAVVGVVLLMRTDFNQYRGLIAEQVELATGRKLVIAGELNLAISLTPTVEVADVTFANAPWGSRPEMLKLQRLEAEMELLPLLTGDVKVHRIVLVGADIMLETDSKGQGNWMFAKGAEPVATPAAGEGKLPSINTVAIENATLTYRNGVTGETQTVALETLSFAAPDPASPISIEVVGKINGSPVEASGTIGGLTALTGGAALPLDLVVKGGGATATLKGEIARPAQGEGVDLAFTVEGQSVADMSPLAGGAALPPLGPYSLSGTIGNPSGVYKITGLKAKIGGSDLDGDVSVALGGGKPKVTAALSSVVLDAKDFGVTPAPAGAAAAPSDGRVFSDAPLPLAGLNAVDAKVDLSVAKLVKDPVILENVKLAMTLAGGRLTIAGLNAGLAGGTLTIAGVVDAAKEPAALDATVTARGVEAGALLQTFGIKGVLSGGKSNADLSLRGRGASVRALMAGADGGVNFEMGQGKIENGFAKLLLADLFQVIASGGADSSQVNCMVTRFDIKKGLATSNGLVVDTSGATIVGSGKIKLDSEKLDLRFDPTAKQTNLVNLAVPVKVGGTLAQPSVTPDAAALAAGVAGTVVGVASGAGIVGALAGLTGGTSSTSSGSAPAGDNPCASALAQGGQAPAPQPGQQAPAPAPSTGEQILDGAGETIEGVGDAIKGLFN